MNEFKNEIMPPLNNSLKKAENAVAQENPDMPMKLKFEVSDKETIEKLLSISDLTEPAMEGVERNIVGKVFDSLMKGLAESNFPNIQVVRGSFVGTGNNYHRNIER